MTIFSGNDKMYQLIDSNFNLLPVINRLGIKTGVKDKTILNICAESNVDTNFFLSIINTYNNEDYFPKDELQSFSPLTIIDYLRKTHEYYINYMLPLIEDIMQKLIDSCKSDCNELKMIKTFYKKYKHELLLHIDDEEKNVFPYITQLVNQKQNPENFSIEAFEKEHTNVDIKLNDLKKLIVKYLTPNYNHNICNEFLINLARFEKDIMDHARIEDKILVPIVIEFEKSIAQ